MGPYRGGQAQYIRIPYADFNALKLPPGKEHENDFILLADIFPTGWHGVSLSGFKPGETIAIFGAGPVGLMAAYSAQLRGASATYVVDRVPERLAAAKKIGCVPIDFSAGDAVDQIIEKNGGMVDRAVDAVGYQAVDKGGSKEVPNIVLENLIRVTRACGGLGIPGLYVPTDPGAPDKLSGEGQIMMPFGKLFEKVSCVDTLPESPALLLLTNKNIGPLPRHRPVQRQAIQPLLARPHHLRRGDAVLCRESRDRDRGRGGRI